MVFNIYLGIIVGVGEGVDHFTYIWMKTIWIDEIYKCN